MSARPLALVLASLVVVSALAAAPPSAADGGDRWGPGTTHSFKYIVVAPADWEGFLEPLLDWRGRTTFHEVIFMPLEDAVSDGQGRDAAARLKDSISREIPEIVHTSSETVLLLVGDADVIPVRRVFTDILQDGNVSDPLNLRWTDDYYVVGAEADWDRDGDGVYGEDGEVLDEIARAHHPFRTHSWRVGRVPASTELEVDRFVTKLLAYERDPPPGDWYDSALVVSGLMDVPNHLDNPFTPDLDGGYELFSDNSYESHRKLMALLPDSYDATWLYDYPRLDGGHWNRSVDTLDHDSMVAAFDRGHSVLAMNGHGWEDGSGLAHYNGSGHSNYWWDWHNAYDYADADNASNGGMLPFAYVAACYVGDVTVRDDRTLERLVMNPRGGAVGMVAGNGENYKGESIANASYGNWFLERRFWSSYFENGPGTALQDAKQAYLDLVSGDGVPHPPLYDAYYTADYLSHNLLGDPMTRTWTRTPSTIRDFSHLDWPEGGGIRVHVSQDDPDRPLPSGSGYHQGPVPDAVVHVEWEGGSAKASSDGSSWVHLGVPVDAGELRATVSARGFLPVEEVWERDVVEPSVSLESVSHKDGSGEYHGSPELGESVTLVASVKVQGRVEQDLVRIRFRVGPEGGELQDLRPDAFGTIETGALIQVEQDWKPPSAGVWTVDAEIDPESELPYEVHDNIQEVDTVLVRGPPEWIGPTVISVSCGEGPGGSVDLRQYLQDPDTPIEDLDIDVHYEGDPERTGVRVSSRDGVVTACTQLPEAEVDLLVTVSDGTHTEELDLTLHLTRDTVPRLGIAGQTLHPATVGGTLEGRLSIENLGPGQAGQVRIVALDGHPDLALSPDGSFTFDAKAPGTHAVRLAIQRPDGSTEPTWQGALLVFQVSLEDVRAPMPVGWRDLRVAAGEEAALQLQAVDLEGGGVTYAIADDAGLDLEVDPDTGRLTLRPGGGDVGEHAVEVTLSDGVNEEDHPINVYVTEAPDPSSMVWVVAALLVVAVLTLLAYLYLWRFRETRA